MPDNLPTSLYYRNLKGVNLKSSEYTLDRAEFLNLRNVDFDVPNALQKRPGSTQAVSTGTSGPIIGLTEYSRLNGASWVVAGSNNALFYLSSNAYTLLDAGWTNGQPQDMLTFVNKLWIADGQRYKTWDGGVSFGIRNVGMPCSVGASLFSAISSSFYGSSAFLVAGVTHATPGASFNTRGVYLAYSYVRDDGYQGAADILSSARNVVQTDTPSNGNEFFTIYPKAYGFTVPAITGISAISLYVAVDTITAGSNQIENIPGHGLKEVGRMGWLINRDVDSRFSSITLKPTADLSRFWRYTTMSTSHLVPLAYGGVTYYSATFVLTGFNNFVNPADPSSAFSGTPFCWFDTNAPKYIDVNQNAMFMSGFSNTPSTVWFSEVGQPEQILPEYNFEVRTNDGDRITGHRTYNGNVIVFKTTSFHKVVGVNPDTFELVELSLEFGAVSNNAIVEYNEKLLFLDRKGIIQYDGASWNCISDGIDDIFRRMNLNAAYEKAVGVHNHYRNQVWFGIPVDGSTENNLTVVYDYLVDAWTFFDGYNASSFAVIKSTLNKPTVWRGSPSGMIYYTGESFYGDNGVGITSLTMSRFEQFQGENSTNVWRRMFLDVSPVSGGTGVINGKVFTDYNQSTVKATFTMYQSQFQNKAEMGVVGKAVAFEASHFSATLPFLLNGYTWAKRHLRNV